MLTKRNGFFMLALAVCVARAGMAGAADAPNPKPPEKSKDPQAYWDPQAEEQKNKGGQYQILCPGLPAAMWNGLVVPMGGVNPVNPSQSPLTYRVGGEKEGDPLKPHPKEPVGFTVFAPKKIERYESLGVVVYISPGQTAPTGGMDNPFSGHCDERRLIGISATTAGNPALPGWRAACAVAAVSLLSRRYDIDPKRVFVCGVSGGGRVTSYVMLQHSDIFRGACPIVGCNAPDMWMQATKLSSANVGQFCGNSRLAILEGGKDFNRAQAKQLYEEWFSKKMRHAVYIEEPACAHAVPGDPYRVQVLDFWDKPLILGSAAQWKTMQKEIANPKKRGQNFEALVRMRPAMHVKEWGLDALTAYETLSADLDKTVKAIEAQIAAGDFKAAKADLTKLESDWGNIGKDEAKRMKAGLAKAQEEANRKPKAAK